MALDVRLKAEQCTETWASLALLRVLSCRTHQAAVLQFVAVYLFLSFSFNFAEDRPVLWKEKSPRVPGGSRDAGCAQRQQGPAQVRVLICSPGRGGESKYSCV